MDVRDFRDGISFFVVNHQKWNGGFRRNDESYVIPDFVLTKIFLANIIRHIIKLFNKVLNKELNKE